MATPLAEHSGPHRYMADSAEDKTSAATIAQPSAIATSREDNAQVFRFFDLPRELRDNIFEQPVLAKHWYMRPDMCDDFCIRAEKLNTSLLLVNRQFRDEYVKRCNDQQVLSLRDRTHWTGVTGILAAVDDAKSGILAMCRAEFSTHPRTPNNLRLYLGNSALWYDDLSAVTLRLYLSYQHDLEDCGPCVLGHLQSMMADIAAFQKIAELEVYMIKRTGRQSRVTWSRKLLAQWHRDDSVASIFLGPASHAEESAWEGFKGFEIDFDSPASSWFGEEDEGSEDNGSDNEDDENNDPSNMEPQRERPEDAE